MKDGALRDRTAKLKLAMDLRLARACVCRAVRAVRAVLAMNQRLSATCDPALLHIPPNMTDQGYGHIETAIADAADIWLAKVRPVT